MYLVVNIKLTPAQFAEAFWPPTAAQTSSRWWLPSAAPFAK